MLRVATLILTACLVALISSCADVIEPQPTDNAAWRPLSSHGTTTGHGPLCTGDIDPQFSGGVTTLGLSCPDPFPWQPGLFTAWGYDDCYNLSGSYRDGDQDGVHDGCEFVLANYFAPRLIVDHANEGSCWDASLNRIGGEYFFAVEQRGQNLIRVIYLPSYYADCGSPLPGCALSVCDPHRGDSEAIALDLQYKPATQHWLVDSAFLSAHCFASWPYDTKCKFYDHSELFWAQHDRGAPVIFVSLWKHANYKSRASCDGGAAGADTCDSNSFGMYFPIVTERQNIGSREVPFFGQTTCPSSQYVGWGSTLTDPSVQECGYFQTVNFTGWQSSGTGSAGSYNWLLGVKLGF